MQKRYLNLIDELREQARLIRTGEFAGQMDADLMVSAADAIEELLK